MRRDPAQVGGDQDLGDVVGNVRRRVEAAEQARRPLAERLVGETDPSRRVLVERHGGEGYGGRRPVRQMQPVGVLGGSTPGWPSGIGSGPSVIRLVSIVRTPSWSTPIANRSMLRGAGPNWEPAHLMPSRS